MPESFDDILSYICENAPQTAVAIIIIVIAVLVIYKITNFIFSKLEKRSKVAATYIAFARKLIKAAIILFGIFGIIMQIEPMQQFAVSIMAGSGIAVVIIGFAAQEAMANLIHGTFISMFKPFAIGDRVRIESNGRVGVVENITLRHTVLRTPENNRLIVPNSLIGTSLLENFNYEEDRSCTYLEVGISYDSDMDRAIGIIRDVTQSHKDTLDVRTQEQISAGNPVVDIRVVNFGTPSLDLRAFVWTKDSVTGFFAACDMRYSIKKRFDEEGIKIPYSYQNVVLKNKPRDETAL